MKARTFLAVAAAFVVAAAVLAQDSGKSKMASSSKSKSSGTPIFIPSGDLKWVDLDPTGAPGVKIADLWGNHAKGAYGAYFKLPAGFEAPLHTHTHAMKVIFVSGTYLQTPEGKPEVRLGPGSYMMQPGGNYRHVTKCDKGADCVFFAESNGPFDLKVVDQGAAKK